MATPQQVIEEAEAILEAERIHNKQHPAPPNPNDPLGVLRTTKEKLYGHTEARLFTKPLRELTRETSYGYAVIDFARDILKEPLLPWQAWLVIHMGELNEDGTPRFGTLLILVARQNGKTHLLKVLALYWMFVERLALILGISTTVEYAKESWLKAANMAENVKALADEMPKRGGVRLANGSEHLENIHGSRYKIAAAGRRGGRSLTIDRLIIDEIREHKSYEAWDAAEPATSAVPWAQTVCISNMGDDLSIVLNNLRDSALKTVNPDDYSEDEVDETLGLFEWSAIPGSELMDRFGWACANPSLGYLIEEKKMRAAAIKAKNGDVRTEAGFRTERLCQHVKALDAAIDPEKWAMCANSIETLAQSIKANRPVRPVLCVDVSMDEAHSTVVAAVPLPDNKIRIEIVAAFQGSNAATQMVDQLPQLIKKLRPLAVGWFPSGPAAMASAGIVGGPSAGMASAVGCKLEELKTQAKAVCMGMSGQVQSERIYHSGKDDLLNAHITSVQRLKSGDGWVFSRKGDGQCDAAYAAAGAVHLARTIKQAPKAIVAVR